MALIKVGIHEPLSIDLGKSKINEHGTLELTMKMAESEDAVLNAFVSNTTFQPMESSFRFYAPNMKTFQGETKSSADLASDLLKIRHQLSEIASVFTTKDKVDAAIGGLEMFKGIGIPETDLSKAVGMLHNEELMKKVHTNLSTKFLDLLKSVGVDAEFRMKFLRQSKDKNYAVIPNSSFDTWIESTDVLKEQSQVAYSDWEKENGKDNPNPSASSASSATPEASQKADQLFKKPESSTAPTTNPPPLFKS